MLTATLLVVAAGVAGRGELVYLLVNVALVLPQERQQVSGVRIAVTQDGQRYRVLTEEEVGFVGNGGRAPTKAEQAEPSRFAPLGVGLGGDPWSEISRLGRPAVRSVAVL